MHNKLSVDSSKTKIVLVKSQNHDQQSIMYNNEPLEIVESLKDNGIPSNQSYTDECVTCRLKVRKRA